MSNKSFRTRIKEWTELLFWQYKKWREGNLSNSHYAYFFTTYWGLEESAYLNKKVLDIGCGPRGSLEWATMAAERIGLDPLAESYLKLGAQQHQMRYVASGSEHIPFPDNYFDIISSFNSLDHVEDVAQSCREISRVLKSGGLLLLIVDIHLQATFTEPHTLSWELAQQHFPELELIRVERLAHLYRTRIYANLRARQPLAAGMNEGVLTLLLRKP